MDGSAHTPESVEGTTNTTDAQPLRVQLVVEGEAVRLVLNVVEEASNLQQPCQPQQEELPPDSAVELPSATAWVATGPPCKQHKLLAWRPRKAVLAVPRCAAATIGSCFGRCAAPAVVEV